MSDDTKEPLFTAPIAAFVLPGVILAVLAFEFTLSNQGLAALFDAWGLNPLLIRQGRGELLLSYAFLHGSLLQAVLNALTLLIFSVPLVRAFGRGGWGFVSLFMLFAVTSVAAGLAFCMVHLHDNVTVIGASAAASGIMGAAVRLPWRGEATKVMPFASPQVLALSALVAGFHLLSLLTHREGPVTMAWESHLAAYVIGLVIISPWLRLFHRRYFTII